MTPALRKVNLTAHVASFLALSIAGLTSRDAATVRGAYLAMNVIGQVVIVPLSLAALLIGVVQALGTQWGLFRHYWVLTKFAPTVGATLLLLLHQFTAVAGAARRATESASGALPDVGRLGTQLVVDAGLAGLVLLVTTTLSVFKPWGRTPFGRREPQAERREAPAAVGPPLGLKIFLSVIGAILVGVVMLHLSGRGLGGQGM